MKNGRSIMDKQNARLEDYDNSIKIAEIVIESNIKQKEIHKERINIAIQDYNKWAEENGEKVVELL
jgi:hypothetical protein